MADGHRSKPTSWATVMVIVLGFVLLGFALPVGSTLLWVLGAVALLVGVVMAFAFRIMDDFH
jgi:membrane-bound ClpP family serine protease